MSTDKFEHINKNKYEEVRSDLKTGDIFFASGNYVLSKIIEECTDSIFSHVGFIFTWNNRVLILESVEDDGVRAVPMSQYISNYENSGKPYDGRLFIGRHNTAIDGQKANIMLGEAADDLNRKYNKDEIARILARVTIGLGTPNNVPNEYICSEFVDVCFRKIGIILDRSASGFIYPENIAADKNVTALFEIIT